MANTLERMCICCRKREEKRKLLRFVIEAGRIVWDRDRSRPGRGAYIHPRRSCLFGAVKGRWKHAFRLSGDQPGLKGCSALIRQIEEAVDLD